MNPKVRCYLYSCAGILLLTSIAKLYSAAGSSNILAISDAILHITYRQILLGAGLVELAVAAFLIWGRSAPLRVISLFWLSTNFMLYRFASFFLNVSICPCLGSLTESVPLSKAQVNKLLGFLVLYMFFGSSFLLLRMWENRSSTATGARDDSNVASAPA